MFKANLGLYSRLFYCSLGFIDLVPKIKVCIYLAQCTLHYAEHWTVNVFIIHKMPEVVVVHTCNPSI